MNKIEILNKLAIIFRNLFNDDSLVLTDDLAAKDVEQWTSLSHMLLITEIEKCFLISFKLRELNKMRNVGEMIDVIYSKF